MDYILEIILEILVDGALAGAVDKKVPLPPADIAGAYSAGLVRGNHRPALLGRDRYREVAADRAGAVPSGLLHFLGEKRLEIPNKIKANPSFPHFLPFSVKKKGIFLVKLLLETFCNKPIDYR